MNQCASWAHGSLPVDHGAWPHRNSLEGFMWPMQWTWYVAIGIWSPPLEELILVKHQNKFHGHRVRDVSSTSKVVQNLHREASPEKPHDTLTRCFNNPTPHCCVNNLFHCRLQRIKALFLLFLFSLVLVSQMAAPKKHSDFSAGWWSQWSQAVRHLKNPWLTMCKPSVTSISLHDMVGVNSQLQWVETYAGIVQKSFPQDLIKAKHLLSLFLSFFLGLFVLVPALASGWETLGKGKGGLWL